VFAVAAVDAVLGVLIGLKGILVTEVMGVYVAVVLEEVDFEEMGDFVGLLASSLMLESMIDLISPLSTM
jgi:hypothetical protein